MPCCPFLGTSFCLSSFPLGWIRSNYLSSLFSLKQHLLLKRFSMMCAESTEFLVTKYRLRSASKLKWWWANKSPTCDERYRFRQARKFWMMVTFQWPHRQNNVRKFICECLSNWQLLLLLFLKDIFHLYLLLAESEDMLSISMPDFELYWFFWCQKHPDTISDSVELELLFLWGSKKYGITIIITTINIIVGMIIISIRISCITIYSVWGLMKALLDNWKNKTNQSLSSLHSKSEMRSEKNRSLSAPSIANVDKKW